MGFKKGHKAWNKGLNKDNDERVKKGGESLKGKSTWNKGLTKENDERVALISKKQIGRIAWNKGTHKHKVGVPYKTVGSNYYMYVPSVDRYPMLYHRWLMEEKIGRKLLSSEDVDHIDDDKNNNHIGNLQILTRSEHMKKHNAYLRLHPHLR